MHQVAYGSAWRTLPSRRSVPGFVLPGRTAEPEPAVSRWTAQPSLPVSTPLIPTLWQRTFGLLGSNSILDRDIIAMMCCFRANRGVVEVRGCSH
jgi:hypothetical protein